MDDKTFNALTDRIDRVLKTMIAALNLEQVRFKVHYERDRPDVGCDGAATLAEMHPNWQYAAATIVVYVPLFAEYDDDEIAGVLIHELVHYLIHPISRYGETKEYDLLEERVCTDLALSFRSAIQRAGEETARHYKLEIKRLERQLKLLEKAQKVA